MIWIQLFFETSEQRAEACSEILIQAGAVAVSLEDAKDTPLFEPEPNTEPLWHETRVIGLFENTVDIINIKKFLKPRLQETEYKNLRTEPLEDKDWVSITNQTEALCFGHAPHFLWVLPSNKEPTESEKEKENKETYILLDPGLAFGTGTHPTTALCLSWLADHPPRDEIVLDYGCGSGILGIAALKLKAKTVIAVDHDVQALLSTQNNAAKNNLPEQNIKTVLPKDLETELQKLSSLGLDLGSNPKQKCDLILANILAEPLLQLAPQFSAWIKPQGTLILSGILEHQIETLIECYQPFFTDFETEILNGWGRIRAIAFAERSSSQLIFGQ